MNRLRVLERVLLLVGMILLAVDAGVRVHGVVASRRALLAFAQANEPMAHRDLPPGLDVSLWSEKRIAVFDEVPIAVLGIPKLHLEVPVFRGTDDWTLNRGVGRIPGTARPGEDGNTGIAGHRDGFFRGLK